MDKRQMERLHVDSVNEVNHLNGFITYEENVDNTGKKIDKPC